jgi:trans-aconitate methyltransferase
MGEYQCGDSHKTDRMIARTNVALLHAFDTIVSMISQAAFHFKLVMAPPSL